MPRSRGQERRIKLFDRFSHELTGWSRGECREMVACPVCLKLFQRQHAEIGTLTLAHFPPKAIGGTRQTLLCSGCNHTLGYKVEGHMEQFQRLRQLRELTSCGNLPTTTRAELTFAGKTLAVAVTQGEKLTVTPISQANPPQTPDSKRKFQEAREFHLMFSFSFDFRRAQIALLGAAYLACFHHLGYPFVLTQGMSLVRKQLLNPTEIIIDNFCSMDARDESGHTQIAYVGEPQELDGCLLVAMGRDIVVLPPPHDAGASVYKVLAQFDRKQVQFGVAPLYEEDSLPKTPRIHA